MGNFGCFGKNKNKKQKTSAVVHCSPLIQGIKSLASGTTESSILKGNLLTSSEEE